jgi:hypothetical protein
MVFNDSPPFGIAVQQQGRKQKMQHANSDDWIASHNTSPMDDQLIPSRLDPTLEDTSQQFSPSKRIEIWTGRLAMVSFMTVVIVLVFNSGQ